jgi:peptide/nickel transport system substrate-binding protein
MKPHKQGLSAGRRGWRWVGSVSVGVLAAALLAACGGGGGGGGGGGSSTASDTLTIAIDGFYPQTFEPNASCANQIFQLAYEPLIRISTSGEYEPGIAESWEYSDNNTVFTMKIRDGIKFQDGTDVTVQSVVDTLNHYKSVPGVNDGYLKPWKVKALGEDSVQISYDEPFNAMESILADAGNCNNGMIISEAGLADPEKLKTEMFGAGPYEYVASESEPGDHYTFKPFADYYDDSRQNWKTIVVRVIADANTALNALETGQVQVDITGGTSLVTQAESKGFDATVSRGYGHTLMLWDRDGEVFEPLGDVRVRRALALALDRESIAKAVGPAAQPLDQFSPEGSAGHDPDLPSKYTYDVDEAKQLLAEAGYPDGFSMTVIINPDDKDIQTTASAAAAQLAEIGVEVELKSIAGVAWWGDAATKKYPAGVASYGLYGYNDWNRLYKMPYSAVWNPWASTDPDLDEAYNALNTASEATFEDAATQFNDVMTDKVWYVPMVNSPLFVYSEGIDLGSPEPMGNFAVAGAWTPKG